MEVIDCDFCHQPLTFDPNVDNEPIMQLAPGLIYYPTKGFGSYNGVEVHMQCAVNYQNYAVSEGFVSFNG